MLTIQILCIGKLKEKFWKEACAEYAKRLSGFCRFSIMELEESRVPENASRAQIENALKEEGTRILAKAGSAQLIALCIEGRELSSPELSKELQQAAVNGISRIVFAIGGSWGLSEEVKRAAKRRLSMSPMTFPHQLARVMLCEQIYRAFQIANDGKYHK